MKGGGVYYCLGKRGEKTINKCIIEAMMRDDTVINPLTFSSMAGFIFVLHRQNGIVDAAGDIFIRSDNIAVNGKKKQRAGSGGVVVSSIVIKIVMKRNDPDDEDLDDLQLVLPTDPGYDSDDDDNEIEKSSLESDDIIIEQKNHNELYQTFHLGEKMVPSLIGDLIEFDEDNIRCMITAIQRKPDTAKRAKVIRVFEYFLDQIPKHKTSVVMMCMEMVGDDTRAAGGAGDNTYKVISSVENRRLRVAAARGAGAIQLLCMRKDKKQLVDAHEGNWFIDTENRDNVRAIDFGRVADIADKDTIIDEIWKYKRSRQSAFHTKTSQGTFLSKITSRNALESYYDQFIGIMRQTSPLPFLVDMTADSGTAHRNIHFCLVFASLIDNAITSNSYPDWDQAQMVWAYQEIWGVDIIPDKHKKEPIHHIHTLDFDYDVFMSNMKSVNLSCRRVKKSYDEIARLILLYTSTPDGSAKPHVSLSAAMTRKKKTAIARGITATKLGEFVSFTDISNIGGVAIRPGVECAILGGGGGGARRTRRRPLPRKN